MASSSHRSDDHTEQNIDHSRMATNNLSSTIVLQLLRKDNYANWCAWMKNYLLAQDLWDIVQATTRPPNKYKDIVGFKAWRKNNAAALHAILISCEVDILPEIRDITSAKIVWDKLASLNKLDKSSSIPDDSSSNISGDHLDEYEPLQTAINRGDWDKAVHFVKDHEGARSAKISEDGGTVLHAAVRAGNLEIVEKLVELLSPEQLEITDYELFTALSRAVKLQNNIEMVDCMLRRNINLLNIPDGFGCIPLVTALEAGNLKVFRHLHSVYLPDQALRDIDASNALYHFIRLNSFGLALHFLDKWQDSAICKNYYDSSALTALAENPSAFLSGNELVFWKRWIYVCIPIQSACFSKEIRIEIGNPNQHQNDQELNVCRSVLGLLRRLSLGLLKLLGIKQIYDMKLLHYQAHRLLRQMCRQVKQMNRDHVMDAIFVAVRNGIVEFIDEILKVDDTLVSVTDEMGRGIIFYAVLHRQAKVYRRIYGIVKNNWSTQVSRCDESGNTLLHMAAMLEPSTTRDRIAGDALKMQSELHWFKKVERICPPRIKDIRNDTNMTARELFTHNHTNMMKEGEKWTKDVASACTVIGALIITIMFTAAFTVPGGNDQDKGFPMFSHKRLFKVFIISDALSFIFSSTSVLVFLGMVTSRYAEEDFYRSLPLKMMLGHCTLMFSIATMMIAFCVGLLIILPEMSGMVLLVSCLASFSVILFAFMLFPLLFHMSKQIITSVIVRVYSILTSVIVRCRRLF